MQCEADEENEWSRTDGYDDNHSAEVQRSSALNVQILRASIKPD
jgi:hypothetical protein